MAKLTKIIKNIAFIVASIFLLHYCANQIPPSGGDVDKIPPEIVQVYPLNGTTNFTDDFIEITFSEYVDKRSVQESVFISPALEGKVEFDWGETSVEITFAEELLENTTYTVTVGTDVIDLNNRNNMSEAYTFAFSTGDKIDTGIIEGKIYDNEPLGIMIFAYLVADTLPNPLTQKPNYLSQVGMKGNYKLQGLADGEYKVYAVKDNFRDLVYNVGEDKYGVQNKHLFLSEMDTVITGLNFMLTKADTTEPHISSITMTDRYHIQLEFSEPVDSTRLSVNNFYVYDSTALQKFNPDYFFKGKAGDKKFYLALDDSLIGDNANYLYVTDLFDRKNNRLISESIYFDVSEQPDTLKPSIEIRETQFPVNTVDLIEPVITFAYNDGVNLNSLQDKITIVDQRNKQIPYRISMIDDSKFLLKIAEKLRSNEQYSLMIDQIGLKDLAGNSADSTFEFAFSTINELEFSGASGKVNVGEGIDQNQVWANLKNVEDKKIRYANKIKSNKVFLFDRVIPGKYLLWFFEDTDSNQTYSFGEVFPQKYSEKFIYYSDTLNLRACWPVGDITVTFD